MERHAGAARFAYNWALARVKANVGQREAERSYGLDGDQLTPGLGWNLPALRRAWNQAKGEVAPWWGECSKEAFNTGLDAVARGLNNFRDSKSGKRAGRKVGFPRFKARRRTTPSVRFTTGVIRVEPDRHHVTLPRVGRIKPTSPRGNWPADWKPGPPTGNGGLRDVNSPEFPSLATVDVAQHVVAPERAHGSWASKLTWMWRLIEFAPFAAGWCVRKPL